MTPEPEEPPMIVQAPREWDGIGQALRAAYRNHRAPPPDIAGALARLDAVQTQSTNSR